VSATLGSFYYTMTAGRSAWLDAETLIKGKEVGEDAQPARYTYQLRVR
jgi:hypothetical protein